MNTTFASLDDFRGAVMILPPEDADRLRTSFVGARLDPHLDTQAADVLALRRFADGLAYTGYLWDFLSDKATVTEEEVWRRVETRPTILAMWDVHSTERVQIPDYFKFP